MTNPSENKNPFPEPTPTGETAKSTPESNRPSSSENLGNGKKREEISFSGFRSRKPKGEDFMAFARENTKDTISYVLMIVGILLIFFAPIYGGLIVGIIFALYFTKELTYIWQNANELVEQYGMVKSLILGGTILALFIFAPFVFIGAAILVVIKILLIPEGGTGVKK